MKKPLVSIIVPTYNRAHLIVESLESILAQTYKYWECIIVDDGSRDDTLELVNTYLEKDSRFNLYCRPDSRKKGASSCRNIGLERANGKFIQFLDSDDLMMKNKLEEQLEICSGNLTLITCKWGGFENKIDLKSRFKYKYNCYRNFRKSANLLKTFGKKDEFLPPHVYLTPKTLIDKAGPWNEELSNNDDAEFFTRVILSAKSIKFSPKAAVYYRYSGSDKLSIINSEKSILSAVKSWKLIEAHILRDKHNSALIYVENAKRFLTNLIKKKFPEIMEKENKFFQNKI